MARSRFQLKRVYEEASGDDGYRVLVERLWPRGIRKEALAHDLWLKEVAPSTELRKWFSHKPERWDEFRKRYAAELSQQAEALEALLQRPKRERITLLFSSRDLEHNNAVALREFLDRPRS